MNNLNDLLSEPSPIIMGILNVTPDSFSDGGDHYPVGRAVERSLQMVIEGAQIIDIGGESSRPAGAAYGKGSRPVSAEEEIHRVIPVIRELKERNIQALISIDTTKAVVAQAAIEAGADIINDVSGGSSDPEMFKLAATLDVPMILMHGHGPNFKKPTVDEYAYDDVVEEVESYLSKQIEAARSAGVKTIVADVGIGFAKGYEDNLRLLKHLDRFSSLGVPMMLGVSRKTTIGRAQGNNAPIKERVVGGIVAACYAVERGIRIVRTHDVNATREAFSVMNAIVSVPDEVLS